MADATMSHSFQIGTFAPEALPQLLNDPVVRDSLTDDGGFLHSVLQ
jgi:hypothetical protein